MKPETLPKTGDFRLFLQQELMRRCKQNESYSLRSFARSLGVSSSALSAILAGKRPLTEKTAIRLGSALGLRADEMRKFKTSTDRRAKKEAAVQQLAIDAFACISDWYYFPMLELIRLKGFTPDAAWVARKLGLTRSEVRIAIERLQRVGLLRIDADGTWTDTSATGHLSTINGELTNAAAILLQAQVLELAIKAVKELPIEVRSHTTMTVAINPRDIPEAKIKIQKFRRELAEFFERREKPEQVYQFNCALFPVTKLET